MLYCFYVYRCAARPGRWLLRRRAPPCLPASTCRPRRRRRAPAGAWLGVAGNVFVAAFERCGLRRRRAPRGCEPVAAPPAGRPHGLASIENEPENNILKHLQLFYCTFSFVYRSTSVAASYSDAPWSERRDGRRPSNVPPAGALSSSPEHGGGGGSYLQAFNHLTSPDAKLTLVRQVRLAMAIGAQ